MLVKNFSTKMNKNKKMKKKNKVIDQEPKVSYAEALSNLALNFKTDLRLDGKKKNDPESL